MESLECSVMLSSLVLRLDACGLGLAYLSLIIADAVRSIVINIHNRKIKCLRVKLVYGS